jgi:CheY-like chemotaxis protein
MSARIAIVDDLPDISLMICRIAERLGYQTPTVFGDGESFVRAIMKDNLNFDVVFMDYRLPAMTGIEVAKIVKQYKNKTSVVMMSGYDFAKERAVSLDLPFLAKPFTKARFEEVLNGVFS